MVRQVRVVIEICGQSARPLAFILYDWALAWFINYLIVKDCLNVHISSASKKIWLTGRCLFSASVEILSLLRTHWFKKRSMIKRLFDPDKKPAMGSFWNLNSKSLNDCPRTYLAWFWSHLPGYNVAYHRTIKLKNKNIGTRNTHCITFTLQEGKNEPNLTTIAAF